MKSRRAVAALLLLLLPVLAVVQVGAQQVSQKKDIAVFKLSYYQWNIPDSVLGGIDEELQGVFVNIGRFNVLGMTQRLEPGDLSQFTDKIKAYKEVRAEMPETVQMGREFFTQADFERLVGSFIVVVPSVASYVLEVKDSGEFHVSVKTSFSFINVEEGRTFAQTFVETEGTEKSPDGAARSALDGIAMLLTYEIRKIPEFQLKTGVLEVKGSEVVLELGRDMGIKVGDEYVLVSSRVLDSGKTLTSETGLLVIKEVSDEVSVGKVLYAHPRPEEGDQLREFPLRGVETTPYLHVASGVLFDRSITAMAGLRNSVSRGFYGFRPIFGLEVPFITNIAAAIPVNLYLGGEYMVHLGRLAVTPMASFAVGGAYLWYLGDSASEDEKFWFTHAGGKANVSISYLFNKKLKLTADLGYMLMFSFIPTKVFANDLFFPDYDGIFVGAGLTIKL
jgi:hypothetical protein